jgi:hypothetical protein
MAVAICTSAITSEPVSWTMAVGGAYPVGPTYVLPL